MQETRRGGGGKKKVTRKGVKKSEAGRQARHTPKCLGYQTIANQDIFVVHENIATQSEACFYACIV